jgi:hypothetical protein
MPTEKKKLKNPRHAGCRLSRGHAETGSHVFGERR